MNEEKPIKEIIDEYIEKKREADAIDAQITPLRDRIFKYMQEQKLEKLEREGQGNFSIEERRKWEFPVEVKELSAKVTEAEKEAKALGTATYTKTTFLKFTEQKSKEDSGINE